MNREKYGYKRMKTIPAKSILTPKKDGDTWFGAQWNMNLYRGCNGGCIYCDSRSECYQIEKFDEVKAKANALALLEKELSSKRSTGVVGMGAMSDPYNSFERQEKLTRGALMLLHRKEFGVTIATKSDLILRDIDLLQAIDAHSPVCIKLTVTTADDDLSRKIEPRSPVSSRRLEALERLSRKGIYAGILLMPVLPFLTDSDENILQIVKRAKESGAKFIYPYYGVTLRGNQKQYYYQQLDRLFPGTKAKYLSGYPDGYEYRSKGARRLRILLEAACDEAGIVYRMEDIIRGYQQKTRGGQIGFFE